MPFMPHIDRLDPNEQEDSPSRSEDSSEASETASGQATALSHTEPLWELDTLRLRGGVCQRLVSCRHDVTGIVWKCWRPEARLYRILQVSSLTLITKVAHFSGPGCD